MKQFGLIGKELGHSFSPSYFTKKFRGLNINASYQAFELKNISEFTDLINQQTLDGLNVTIPYKEAIIPLLDFLTAEAYEIKAVNTVVFRNGQLIGHNTDSEGFWQDVSPMLYSEKKTALVLGSGGSSKAITYALKKRNWLVKTVSRSSKKGLLYTDLTKQIIEEASLIVNTTPAGMYPNLNNKPPFPTEYVNSNHTVYDLIYNPEETKFISECRNQGANIKNGYGMLINQAELSYTTWQEGVQGSLYKTY